MAKTKKKIAAGKVTKKQVVVESVKEPESELMFPRNLLEPIGDFLADQIKKLEFRKNSLAEEDPFTDTQRVNNNAAIDDDASEQEGHARVGAIRKQTDRQIIQLKKAFARVKIGKYGLCENCGKMIDTDRLVIYPEATKCVDCEKKAEK
jgi:RNA polymerase-binding transcription factor DksA